MHHDEIESNLRQVGVYLDEENLTGEILILGGAYMTLVLRQREATKDVDAYFVSNPTAIREAAKRVDGERGLPDDWLNDAARGFLYIHPDVTPWLECPGLRVYAPNPEYIFAMKALAGRPEGIRDLEALRPVVGIASATEALDLVAKYIPHRLLTPRVQYLVEDLFHEC